MKTLAFAAVAAAFVAAPAYAQDAGTARDGLHVEARATYETPTVSSVVENGDVYKIGSAFALGGEIGYDLAVGNAVTVGPYAQYEISNVETCDVDFCLSGKDYTEFGALVSYATSAKGALYGKLGYGSMTLEASDGTDSATETGSGFAFALGYELGLGKSFYGKIEGGYADVGQIDGVNFQRRHFGAALGARF